MPQPISPQSWPTAAAYDIQAVISGLYVYPVKSCAGVSLQAAELHETGLAYDRAWMVVDAQGNFLTQRELPRMALITPQLKHFEMVLRAPGMLALHVQLDAVAAQAPRRVRVWDDDVPAFEMGDVAAQWFSDFLGCDARLVRFDPAHQRLSDKRWTGEVDAPNHFNDGFALLVLSQASLDQLNGKLHAVGHAAAVMARFRPNLVLTHAPGAEALAPHDEDRLSTLHISALGGVVRLLPVKPCPRCPIPNIEPTTAHSSPEVGDTLQSYRQDPRVNGAVTFGMNAIVLEGAGLVLQVGQRVMADVVFD